MPEASFPIQYLAPLLLLFVSTTLGACSGGDFGRARADILNDDMHRWIGAEATSSAGLKPSQFQLTDAERQLRDLAYPLIEPPHSRPAWRTVFGDYQPIASPWRQAPLFDRTAYGRALIDEPHRSHTSRYSQLIDDVRDDITRFELFYATAIPVLELDRKRNATLVHISELSPREHADAVARMQENSFGRSMGATMSATEGLVLSLGAGTAGASGSRRHGRRRRSSDRRTCFPNRQPADYATARRRTSTHDARLKAPTCRGVSVFALAKA
jgi:hypothetical protein